VIKERYYAFKRRVDTTLQECKTGCKKIYGKAKSHPLNYLIIIFIFTAALVSLVEIPKLQVLDIYNTTEKAKQENQDRTTLAQIFGGVAIWIELYYTWRQITISEEDLKIMELCN
jgi:hypothetical protein